MEQENINLFLLDNGIRPLRKRVLIYNYLQTKKNHPTVEIIYKDLLPEAPTLSKTTVYNVLNLFLEKNLIQALCIEGNELRYDADISTHGHFKCSKCGRVFDFDIKESNHPTIDLKDFVAHQIHYYVIGHCSECSK